eukprot:gene5612-6303_t
MGSLPAKLVATRTKDKKIRVKEDCVLKDETGKSVFRVWGDLIDQLEDGHAYLFENLVVRQFQSATFLSTIYNTKFAETEQQIDNVTGPSWLESPITDVVAKSFKFLNNLSVFYRCQVCNRKMTEITGVSSTIKCNICGVCQKLPDCNKEACASLSFLGEDGALVKISLFTKTLLALLDGSGLSLNSTFEDIGDCLLHLEDIKVKFDKQKMSAVAISKCDVPVAVADDGEWTDVCQE